jgi:uncharacterized protein (DUF2062 family)
VSFRRRASEIARWSLIGALIGSVILGAGGRIAMYVIVRATGAVSGFTLGGTLTVVFMGALSGAAGGAIHVITAWVRPTQHGMRMTLYALIMLAITLRGLSPLSGLAVALFLPLVAAFMVTVESAWRRYLSGVSAIQK